MTIPVILAQRLMTSFLRNEGTPYEAFSAYLDHNGEFYMMISVAMKMPIPVIVHTVLVLLGKKPKNSKPAVSIHE